MSVRAIPTSERTRELAGEQGIALVALEQVTHLDLTIDGADEVDPDLQLIKGGGGALLREKIVASASDRLVIIAESKKMVTRLGQFALPVEVVPSAWKILAERISAIGCVPNLRRRADGREVFVTDERNYLLDCAFGAIEDHRGLASTLANLPGVVEHGLFIDMADVVIIGRGDGTELLRRSTSLSSAATVGTKPARSKGESHGRARQR